MKAAPSKPGRYDPVVAAAIHQRSERGETLTALAREHCVSRTSIRNWLDRYLWDAATAEELLVEKEITA